MARTLLKRAQALSLVVASLVGACRELDPLTVTTCLEDADCLAPRRCVQQRCRFLGPQDSLRARGILFETSGVYPTGETPVGLVVRDFDEDGELDVAAAFAEQGLAVRRGMGEGRLGAPTFYPVTEVAGGLGAKDLDGDGRDELVVFSESGDPPLSVFPNLGDGRFGAAFELLVGAQMRGGLDFADLDDDGNTDVVVGGRGPWVVARGREDFGLAQPRTIGSSIDGARDIRAMRLGGPDAPVDVVVVNAFSLDLEIYRGDGEGDFGSRTLVQSFSRGGEGRLAVADFDLDGTPDLALSAERGIAVFRGDGLGTLTYEGDYPLISRPSFLAPADIDGDGVVDLVVGSRSDSLFHVLLGRGDGTLEVFDSQDTFEAPTPSGLFPHIVRAADMNGDARLDLVIAGVVPQGPDVVLILLARPSGL